MTSPTSDIDAVCETCHKPHPWPDGTTPRHPFKRGHLSTISTFGPIGGRQKPRDESPVVVRAMPWPFDPVLRQALIDKGILTPQDLTDAEAKIRAVTGEFNDNAGASRG